MDVGGRSEAARRRQSIALEKQRTFSTVENHINQVKRAKGNGEESWECELHVEGDVISEEKAGEMVSIEGQPGGNVDIEDIF